MERDNPLGVDRVHKLIIRFSVPAIVGMVVNSFYNIVDRIFIGNCFYRLIMSVDSRTIMTQSYRTS